MSELLHNIHEIDTVTLAFEPKTSISSRAKISSSIDAYKILKTKWSRQISLYEEFNLLLLDNQNHVMGFSNLSKGGLAATYVDVRLAFCTALLSKSTAMILAHNHPSGSLYPSIQDISLTKKFLEAGKVLDIKIHDHLILTPEDGYYSFADEGELII